MKSLSAEWLTCQEITRRLLKTRGWQLIGMSEDALVAATLDDLQAQQYSLQEKVIEKCAARQYVAAFYQACQAHGTPLQSEAFQCLGKRLVRIALYKTGDEEWAKDCAQRAIKTIFEKLDTCANPKSFFSWTRAIVLNEYYQDLRRMGRHPEESLDTSPDSEHASSDEEETSLGRAAVETPEDLFADLEGDLTARQLVHHIQQILGDSRQWRVVAEFYLDGRSYSEIAERLETTTNNVYLIMHRAIQKLRNDPRFTQELESFFGEDA